VGRRAAVPRQRDASGGSNELKARVGSTVFRRLENMGVFVAETPSPSTVVTPRYCGVNRSKQSPTAT
jgi:hypothetical protein